MKPLLILFALLSAVTVGGSALAHAQPEAEQLGTTVRHHRLPPGLCRAAMTQGASTCRATSVLTTGDSPHLVTDAALTAASGCSPSRPSRTCTKHYRRYRDYVWTICFGMRNRCTDHVSPAWFKIRQEGRYWRGLTCQWSYSLPAPHNCRSRFAWTKDHGWRHRSFSPGNKTGWHRCRRISSSGWTLQIDECWRNRRGDPAGRPARFRFKAGRVGMRWTACSSDARQCRTYGSWLKLWPNGRTQKRGDWA